MTSSRRKEVIFAAGILALSLGLAIRSFLYAADSSQFPRFLMVLQTVFSAVLLVRQLVVAKAEAAVGGAPTAAKKKFLDVFGAPLAVFAATGAYLACIQFLGYFVSTALFLAGGMYLFGRHKPLVLVGVSAVFMLVIYGLFVLFIGVRLPGGLLF
jgi:asparagine N-glycosylation enzyme membrane subunit Stt3